MSRVDPECFPSAACSDNNVCPECFHDPDRAARIVDLGEPGDCSYCETFRKHVLSMDEIAEFIGERMATFYGRAVDQLPYVSKEGGYIGRHEDTQNCLFERIGLELKTPGFEELQDDILGVIGDDAWCDYDWLSLEINESLQSSWEQFCAAVKTQRRFFFHNIGDKGSSHPDERSIFRFLHELASIIEGRELIKSLDPGFKLYRARQAAKGEKFSTAKELGAPPAKVATQSNRMNPPGIPMFYGADNAKLAAAETRGSSLCVGEFKLIKSLRIIDLEDLPETPGIFSECTREERQTLIFLKKLSATFAKPVPQNDRVNVDYIPTQIVTEFLQDYEFYNGAIHGIRYRTSPGVPGSNIVLFTDNDLAIEPHQDAAKAAEDQWLQLTDVTYCADPARMRPKAR